MVIHLIVRRCLGECKEGGNGGGKGSYKKRIVLYRIGMTSLQKIQKTKICKALLKHHKNIYLFIYFFLRMILREKCPNTEIFSGPYFSVLSPNTGKYGPEKFRIWTLFT